MADATVTLMQYTHDQVNRVLVVNVAAGDETVHLSRVEVVSGAFTHTGPAEYDASVPPSETLDLRVPLGDPDCSVDLDEDDISVDFAVPDADPVTVDSPDGANFLAELHARECAAQDAITRVPLDWGPRWHTTGSGKDFRLTAPLRVGPVGVSRARVTGIDGSVIFVAQVAFLPLSLDSGETRTLPVTFRPNRCDSHVWETSRGFQFALRLTFGDDPVEVLVPVVPPRAKQQLLSRAWRAQCGAG